MRTWWMLMLLVPLAAGQGHDHAPGNGYVIASDLGPDGLAYVGSPAHFELIAFGDDHVPDFHQDLPVRVSLDGEVLYETTAVSGHDYDGVHGFDIVFPRAGQWSMELLGNQGVLAHRNGTVLDVEKTGWSGNRMIGGPIVGVDAFEVEIDTSVGDERANHSDMLVEVFQDGALVFRTHLHIHDEPVKFLYRHDAGTPATMQATRYTAFPTSNGAPLSPASTTMTIPANTPIPLPAQPVIPGDLPDKNVAEIAAGGMYDLVGTYDPWTQVGPDTLQHLNVLVMDPDTGLPVQHVDFEATLSGPPGLIFQSSSLHEYDGIYTLETRQRLPGQYVLDVTASRGDWSQDIQLTYYVLPPVLPTVAGPQEVSLAAGAIDIGAVTPLSWQVQNPAGQPFAHGELDFAIRQKGDGTSSDQYLVRDKLHTHADGTFPVQYRFPAAGDYDLLTDPFPLDPQPVGPFLHDGALGAGHRVTATGEAPTMATDETTGQDTVDDQATPLPLFVLLVGLVAATFLRRKP